MSAEQDQAAPHQAERYLVVSADTHAGASLYDYKPNLAARWHDEFETWAAQYRDPWIDLNATSGQHRLGALSAVDSVNWDSEHRARDLDAEGIAGEVIYPNTAPPFFPSGSITAPAPVTRPDYERRWAGVQAHNRWLADFCAQLPGRRAGIAQVFVNDVDDTVAEIEWAKEAGLLGGILLPGIAPNTGVEPLYSESYDRIWAVCADLGVPVNFHGSAGNGEIGGRAQEHIERSIAAIEFAFFCHRTLWHLIVGGVFERHPVLKCVLTEQQGIDWVPETLEQLDRWFTASKSPAFGNERYHAKTFAAFSMKPSEYFRRNCYLGASFLTPREVPCLPQVGVDRAMWGSDYPHAEGTFPYTRQALRASLAGLSPAECRLILGETALRVYGMDRELLRRAADRIGPTVEEVAQPLPQAAWPAMPDDTVCRVFAREPVWV
jgi:predicted TIM-barrel fold metal-dependent hydrolase